MVGWVSSIPADKSQTQASPPSWLATTLSRRKRTGSDSALRVAASWMAASVESGSRTNGTKVHSPLPIDANRDFDIHLILTDIEFNIKSHSA